MPQNNLICCCVINQNLDQVWSILPALELLSLGVNSRGVAAPMQTKWIILDLIKTSLKTTIQNIVKKCLNVNGEDCSAKIKVRYYIDDKIIILLKKTSRRK